MYKTVKVALLGAAKSGKSCLANALAMQKFNHEYHTTIGANMTHRCIDSEKLKFVFLDLSGVERFQFIVESYIQTADMVLLCYDAHDYTSYQKMTELREKFNHLIGNRPNAVVALKTDLAKTFKPSEWGRDLAVRYDFPFLRSSAINGDIQEVLNWIMKDLVDTKEVGYLRIDEEKIPLRYCGCENFCLLQ